jgi:hypothetical protein
MNILERLIFESRRGIFHEFEGLMTHFEPKDTALYRRLLPLAFDMPDQPVVTLFSADYLRVVMFPTTRYQEWSVLLRCRWHDVEVEHSYLMPVTSRTALLGGRYMGFSKILIDDITFTSNNGMHTATSKYKGALQVELDFKPGLTRPLAAWEQTLVGSETFFKGRLFQLYPPGRGPRVKEIVQHHIVPPRWAPEQGMVKVMVGPDEPWAGLVPDEGEFPGVYNHFVGSFNLITD